MTIVGGFDVHRKQITFDYGRHRYRGGAVGSDPSGDPEGAAGLAG